MPENTTKSLLVVTSIFVVIAIILSALLRFVLPRNKNYLTALLKGILNNLHQTYFCGFTFDLICWRNFFPRFSKFVDYGFCGGVAGLSMLALRGNRTARLIEIHYPSEDEDPYWRHRFVEFRFMFVWFVLDPCWLNFGIMLRQKYYKGLKLDYTIAHVCKYREFWSYQFSEEMYEKLRHPKTSWQFYEIYDAYAWMEGYADFFHPDIKTLSADWQGEYPSPGFDIRYGDKQILFTRRIMREFMARPKRKQPKARAVRLAQRGGAYSTRLCSLRRRARGYGYCSAGVQRLLRSYLTQIPQLSRH